MFLHGKSIQIWLMQVCFWSLLLTWSIYYTGLLLHLIFALMRDDLTNTKANWKDGIG